LLRCNKTDNNKFNAGGQGGIIEKLDWNSNVLWSYEISDLNNCQHHDAIQLPNGNIVTIAWESHTKIDAQNNGRVTLGSEMWSEKIVEIQPVGTDSGIIVWQWRAWDHLIQDADITKLNYGVVADHPELLNINIGTLSAATADWLHFNSLDYNAVLDQIMVGSHEISEAYIIDHSTTLEEAATHSGGNSGRGGDLMYRWGNPQNYQRGTTDDQKFFEQHNLHWISAAGKILLFNNGIGRPGDDYSTAETFTLPAMVGNNYPIETNAAYEPQTQDWIYKADPPGSLFSIVQGGAQRLPNGNTLICNGTSGEFLEIDSAGNNLWKYISPVDKNHILEQGDLTLLNDCFRATYLPFYYPGFAGNLLTPGQPIELNPNSYDCENLPDNVAVTELIEKNPVVYPNPFRNNFAIHIPVELHNTILQVYDLAGRLIYEEKINSAVSQSDHIVTLPPQQGMVIISLKDELGKYNWRTAAVAQ
ncbi:MAG: aryl-sulfate sulfotransferase, partial [Chitinophagales bacterium]